MTPFTSNSPLGVTLQSLWGVWTHSQGVTRRPFAIASLLQVTAYHCLPLFIQNFNSHHVFSLWPTSLQLLTKNEQTKKSIQHPFRHLTSTCCLTWILYSFRSLCRQLPVSRFVNPRTTITHSNSADQVRPLHLFTSHGCILVYYSMCRVE